ncbi:hypothetical protein D9V79_00765 [Buchnera aphidicola (Stegophylla sp.)]|uniref:Uncharacterized protein n=1 Tax=Buchnera aphidicola (Stegophylla sp.) TaxID=2315800 RepID=A0A4D6Y9G3_9GAMM|nr:hypothetical protein D9V79_00765 [Buchnera aphidicola (Stegophylla sp.)]
MFHLNIKNYNNPNNLCSFIGIFIECVSFICLLIFSYVYPIYYSTEYVLEFFQFHINKSL